MAELPYLTSDLAGTGGRIKVYLEDFQVDEIPLYQPCGKGTHAYFRIRKAGVPTQVAVDRIARFMGVRPSDIGFAGLKDSQAIATQMMSLEYADAGKLRRFRDANIQVLDVTWHGNKLRVGHLAGNRFVIRIRFGGQDGPDGSGADAPDAGGAALGPAERLLRAQAVLDVLARRGAPNYFGQQRFGARGDTAVLGAALVRGDLEKFVNVFLGRAAPHDPPDCRAARDAFDTGFFDRAMQRWPRHYTDQRRALVAYKRRRNASAAVAAVGKRLKRLFVSAFQSEIFNEVLARRIQEIDRVALGDLAQKEDSGGVFLVEDEATEQPRAQAFEISPTGPIVGPRCNSPRGRPGEIESAVIAKFNIRPEDFARVGSLHSKGGRRALRFKLDSPRLAAGQDRHGRYIELAFTAPSGSYATVVLREIMKGPKAVNP
ncbi:MAG: tRNA pseudouridine(13) synthase TruD [Phycisphaerae bacterium]